jgi:hypothetical protein
MEMTRVKWDEGMAARCLGRVKDHYTVVKSVVADKPVAPVEKPVPKVRYWDEFRKAIDIASQK